MEREVYQFTIPGWNPPSINRLMQGKLKDRIRIKQVSQQIVQFNAAATDIPKATGPRKVTIVVAMPVRNGNRPDPDNLPKTVLDGLVKAGMLVDDSAEWCRCTVRVEAGGEKSTTIWLEELE